MEKQRNFESLATSLLSDAKSLLRTWLPNGRLVGNEYTSGDLGGAPGESLKINIQTGRWCDFATGDKGGDLISLYASIRRISNPEAYDVLCGGYDIYPASQPQVELKRLTPPPSNAPKPNFHDTECGDPVAIYTYKTKSGGVYNYICRHELDGGKKFTPHTWCADDAMWVRKHMAAPRVLYNLNLITDRQDWPILIVEGEKAADAAHRVCGHKYVVTTWPGGAQAIGKADLTPLHGRNVVLWPDADDAGIQAMNKLAGLLMGKGGTIKIINPEGLEAKHDAADLFNDQAMSYDQWLVWARPRTAPYFGAEVTPLVPMAPNPAPPPPRQEDMDDNSPQVLWAKYGLQIVNNKPAPNLLNIQRIFLNHTSFGDLCYFDEFFNQAFIKDGDVYRPFTDNDAISIAIKIQGQLAMPTVSDELVYKSVKAYAMFKTVSSPKAWMETLKWDGVQRVGKWAHTYMGARDSEYHDAVSKNFWISMVARIYQPGCKADNMIILEGKQGLGKSTALSIIGGAWYGESTESVQSKDFYICLGGKMLVEIGEMHTFSRGDVSRVKQIMSATKDTYREPYGRTSSDHPRRCIFAGTTNDAQYLNDPTGARRFWPIKTGKIDNTLLKQDRDQLFAEAIHLFKSGEPWWLVPEREAAVIQEQVRVADTWETPISDYVSAKVVVTLNQVIQEGLGIQSQEKVTKALQLRAADCLRAIGWVKRGQNGRGGPVYWCAPENADVPLSTLVASTGGVFDGF